MSKAAAVVVGGSDHNEPRTPLSNKSHKTKQHNNVTALGSSAESFGQHLHSYSTTLQQK